MAWAYEISDFLYGFPEISKEWFTPRLLRALRAMLADIAGSMEPLQAVWIKFCIKKSLHIIQIRIYLPVHCQVEQKTTAGSKTFFDPWLLIFRYQMSDKTFHDTDGEKLIWETRDGAYLDYLLDGRWQIHLISQPINYDPSLSRLVITILINLSTEVQ